MTYKKLGLTDLIRAVQKKVQDKTKLTCYDSVPKDAESPFYFAEVVKVTPSNTKTAFRDIFTVWIHAISEPGDSSVGIYKLIEELQEAMTEDIELPEGYELIMQTDGGLQTIQTDETNEKHAVEVYEFMVCYGFKCKI